ncbi:MAG: tetratricopeptide repeat protein [Fluviicola sp.]
MTKEKKRSVFIICLFVLINGFVFANKSMWKDESFQQLDKEQFRRLEEGKEDPLFISKLIIEKANNRPSIYLINAYTVSGIVNKNKGFYVTALDNYLKASKISLELKDEGRYSASLNNIGIIYVLQENYSKAIYYFNKSLEIEEDRKDPLQKSIRYFNLGDCYKELSKYNEAIGFYTNSLLIENKLKNEVGIIYAQLGLAEVYISTKRIADAEQALSEIEKMQEAFDNESKVLFLRLKGKLSKKKLQFDAAENFFMEAKDLSERNELINEQVKVTQNLSELFELKKDYKKALKYSKEFLNLNNTLKSNHIKNQLEEMIYQQEIQQKELEIKYLKEQKVLAIKNENAVRKLRQFDIKIAIFSVLSMLSFVGIVVFGLRKMIRINKENEK